MCIRQRHHSPFFLIGNIAFFLTLIILTQGMMLCSAQEEEGSPCIILTRLGELYDLELTGKYDETKYNITFSFDHQNTLANRLAVQIPYKANYDESLDIYEIETDSSVLCNVKYIGLQSDLLGEERARLEVTSMDYYARLVGIHVDETSISFDVHESFCIVLALCSLVPFFLLAPDVVEELQIQLEVDTASKGVYGRILALLLPLLAIALTLLLLESLDMFW